MADVTWLGDEDPSIQAITMYGHRFVRGVPTDVPDKDPRMAKFKGNAFFALEKADPIASKEPEPVDIEKGTEIAAVKAELDRLGLTYRANASLDSLRKQLADASD